MDSVISECLTALRSSVESVRLEARGFRFLVWTLLRILEISYLRAICNCNSPASRAAIGAKTIKRRQSCNNHKLCQLVEIFSNIQMLTLVTM